MKKTILLLAPIFILGGCGTTNNYLASKTVTTEYYRIFDIKTDAPKKQVAKAASSGLGVNISSAEETNPIPTSGDLPEKPGRFKLVNPLQNSAISALAGVNGGANFKIATCDGASWTAKAKRVISGSDSLNLTACLFQYKGGYHLDLYGVLTKKEGGLAQISRDMAQSMVGTPEKWTEKTLLDIVRSIRTETGAVINILEGEPEVIGTPWLDPITTTAK